MVRGDLDGFGGKGKARIIAIVLPERPGDASSATLEALGRPQQCATRNARGIRRVIHLLACYTFEIKKIYARKRFMRGSMRGLEKVV